MAEGVEVKTKSTLVRFTMSVEAANDIKRRFIEMGITGESVSYMDCVLFDAALEVLGEEQAYYGLSDDEWKVIQESRNEKLKQYDCVKTIDVTATWKECCEDTSRQ